MDDKLGVPSAGISWWELKTPWHPSRTGGELSPASWPNSKFLPKPMLGRQCQTTHHNCKEYGGEREREKERERERERENTVVVTL